MRISDWSSDVCSSDLCIPSDLPPSIEQRVQPKRIRCLPEKIAFGNEAMKFAVPIHHRQRADRSEEHTSELQSLMRISYAVFCLKKKKKIHPKQPNHTTLNILYKKQNLTSRLQ